MILSKELNNKIDLSVARLDGKIDFSTAKLEAKFLKLRQKYLNGLWACLLLWF